MQRILQDPYSDYSKYFAPIELVRRLLLTTFIIIEPGNLVSKLMQLYLKLDNSYTYCILLVHM